MAVITQDYSAQHRGIDIAAPYGTSLKAPISGYIQYGESERAGVFARIFDPKTNLAVYLCHLTPDSKEFFKPGTYVYAGQTVGKIGTTGRTTGPHVHITVEKNGNKVNPKEFINYELVIGDKINAFATPMVKDATNYKSFISDKKAKAITLDPKMVDFDDEPIILGISLPVVTSAILLYKKKKKEALEAYNLYAETFGLEKIQKVKKEKKAKVQTQKGLKANVVYSPIYFKIDARKE